MAEKTGKRLADAEVADMREWLALAAHIRQSEDLPPYKWQVHMARLFADRDALAAENADLRGQRERLEPKWLKEGADEWRHLPVRQPTLEEAYDDLVTEMRQLSERAEMRLAKLQDGGGGIR